MSKPSLATAVPTSASYPKIRGIRQTFHHFEPYPQRVRLPDPSNLRPQNRQHPYTRGHTPNSRPGSTPMCPHSPPSWPIRPSRRFVAPAMVRERSEGDHSGSRFRRRAPNTPNLGREEAMQPIYLQMPPWSATNPLSPGDLARALLYQHKPMLRGVGAGVEAPGRRLITRLVISETRMHRPTPLVPIIAPRAPSVAQPRPQTPYVIQ